MKVTFGEAVRQFREQASLSVSALGKKVGTSGQNISLIEHGVNQLKRDPDLVEKLEVVFGVNPGELAKFLPAGHPARKMSAASKGGISIAFIGGISAGGFEPLLAADPGEEVNLRDRFPAGCKLAVVTGKSCHRFGIFDGELVAVADGIKPEDGQFVVAETGEGLTLKGYRDGHLYRWYPDTDEPEVVPYTEDTKLLGVVVQRLGDVRFELPATAKKKGKKK